MPDPDRLAARLRRAPASDDVRASAWDAFHDAADEHDLTDRLRKIALPDDVKADLWDLKSGRAADLKPSGVRVPGDTFGEKIKNAAGALGSGAVGFAKGAARSALNVAEMGMHAGIVPGGIPGQPNAGIAFLRAGVEPANDAERIGGYVETAAELAAPAAQAGKAALSAARAVPGVVRAAGPAAKAAGSVALDVATAHPLRAAGKVLGFILDAAKPAAKAAAPVTREAPVYTGTSMRPTPMPSGGFSLPPVVPRPASAPLSGRLVPAKAVPVEDEIAAALADAPKPMPTVTTPPAAQLPAGYTPRTSAPKPRLVKAPEPDPAAPRKRAYFLKPESELAAVADDAPVTPSGNLDDLPAAWQQHIGQDLFPLTGKEGEAVAAELVQTLRERGLSVSEAMMAVSKNADIPVQYRQQLLKSLSRVKMKAN